MVNDNFMNTLWILKVSKSIHINIHLYHSILIHVHIWSVLNIHHIHHNHIPYIELHNFIRWMAFPYSMDQWHSLAVSSSSKWPSWAKAFRSKAKPIKANWSLLKAAYAESPSRFLVLNYVFLWNFRWGYMELKMMFQTAVRNTPMIFYGSFEHHLKYNRTRVSGR